MSVKAWRQWLVDFREGTLHSLFQPMKWPVVLRAQRAPRELEDYQVREWVVDEGESLILGYKHDLMITPCERPELPAACVCSRCIEYIRPAELHWPSPLKLGDIVPYWDKVGIYALRKPRYGPTLLDGPLVSGYVELFGHIVEHEHGYRAEAAFVCGPLTLHADMPDLAKKIADKYECEVAVDTIGNYKYRYVFGLDGVQISP